MSNCKHCSSSRVASVSAKCSDTFGISIGNDDVDYSGYVPEDVGLGNNEDYIRFSFCLDCGRMQNGNFPLPLTELEENAKAGTFNAEGELPTEVSDCVEFELENKQTGEIGLYVGFIQEIFYVDAKEAEVRVDGFYNPQKGKVETRGILGINKIQKLPVDKLRITDKLW